MFELSDTFCMSEKTGGGGSILVTMVAKTGNF